MSTSPAPSVPSAVSQSDAPSVPRAIPCWHDVLHLSPLVASIRMSLATGRPIPIRVAERELDRARRRRLRDMANRDYLVTDTVANLQADGLGRRLKGAEGTTTLYKLITQTPLRPDRAELLAEAYG